MIAVDGIGQAVMAKGLKLPRKVEQTSDNFRLHFDEFPWSMEYDLKQGRMLPIDGPKIMEKLDTIYIGLVSTPSLMPDHIMLW